MTIKINRHFKFRIFSQIGFPVKKELEYKEILQGNYIWADTMSSTYSVKRDIDVLTF